jgi:hypothetical protein
VFVLQKNKMKKTATIIFQTAAFTQQIYKKCIFVLSLVLISIYVAANPPLATKQQIGMFKNSKTCVVMDGGMSFYNTPIRDAVQKYWKSTEYEFIDQVEFEKRKTNPKYSFLVMMDGAYDKDPGGVSYNYMSLVLGDGSGNLTKMPEFCSVPISYSGDNEADYEYIIPIVVKFMQIHVKNLEKDRLPISINGLKYYNKTGFIQKVLLLNKEKISSAIDSPEKINAVIPNKTKLLSPEDLQKEIIANTANTLIHFHVGPSQDAGAGRCFEMLFDTDGNLYYYNFRKITNDNPDGFNLNDINNIK